MPTHQSDDPIVRRAREAWARVKRDENWNDWIVIGEGLLAGSAECMRLAGTNTPRGRGYNTHMSHWLKANGLADLDGGDRSRLYECMAHRAEIEEWRAKLRPEQRLQFNHPSTVLRRWKASQREERKPATSAKQTKPATSAKPLAEMFEDISRFKVKDIGDAIVANVGRNYALAIADQILKALKRQEAKEAKHTKPATDSPEPSPDPSPEPSPEQVQRVGEVIEEHERKKCEARRAKRQASKP